MAEYNDVIKHFKRMCRYYNGQKCGGCPLYCKGHGCNISHCRMLAFDDKKFQNVVMSWAAEHPEPVYPTWGEWLESFGVVEVTKAKDRIITVMMKPELLNSIPADIAERLGIKPKEC